MISIITGISLFVGTLIIIAFLSRQLNTSKEDSFVQAEMFTSIITVALVGVMGYSAVLFWVGFHEFIPKLTTTTVVTCVVFFLISVITASIIKRINRSQGITIVGENTGLAAA